MLARLKPYLLPLFVFTVSLVATLYNIKGFPMMVGDEGIYVSQAWWLAHFGKLGPYTYWYDHFPLGWAQIGLWQLITGGPFTFGTSVISGRIFMAILKAISSIYLYKIISKLTKSSWLSLIGVFFFSLSPLALTFNRQVLLDNIASLWLIIHLYFLINKPVSGKSFIFASSTLALGILSKESLLFTIPAYLYAIFNSSITTRNRHYLCLISIVTLFFILAFFPLLAILKRELIPAEGLVSFLGTLLFQSSRGNGLPFWQTGSDFMAILGVWLSIDPILILAGLGSIIFNLIFLWKNSPVRYLSLYTLFFLLFIMRGGLVYDFYLIPLIPLLVIHITITLNKLINLTRTRKLLAPFAILLTLVLLYQAQYIFASQATDNQITSTEYLQTKLQHDEVVISDNYNYLDLTLDKQGNIFNPNIIWYSKVESDDTIKQKILANDPGKIDYLLVNDTLNRKLFGGELPFLSHAKDGMILDKQFGNPSPPTSKPYTNESVAIYTHQTQINTTSARTPQDQIDQAFIITLDGKQLDDNAKSIIQSSKPWGILIGFQNAGSTTQLESFMQELSNIISDSTLLITYQSDSGKLSIPWVNTTLRSAYKSPLEASQATIKKSTQLRALGFDANVVTTVDNQDTFLPTIIQASQDSGLIPILEYINPNSNQDGLTQYVIYPPDSNKNSLQDHPYTIFQLPASPDVDMIQQYIELGVDKFVINMVDFSIIRSQLQ